MLLLGGSGSRLYPVTLAVNKHLLPVHDKPLAYYSLAVLMLAGVRRILLITRPQDRDAFQMLLGDGSHLGLQLEYAVQSQPRGIADAFRIGAEFIDRQPVALALGDNLFWGESLRSHLANAAARREGASVFGAKVVDAAGLGVVEIDADGRAVSIDEKPERPRSSIAVPGLYFYDSQVTEFAQQLQPSARGELEITDVNRMYLERDQLHVELLNDDVVWCDAGTPSTLQAAADLVRSIDERDGVKIGCVEEIAFRQEWITATQLDSLARRYENQYGEYLRAIAAA
ncbi:MAG: glucose-1-phosphate thymidylyltransferase RfbA [Pirellulaceae bacterium]|jgi:glucose-1-phosphate thymidylyltransferase|nr:glucose-1-phosphate thymidylyltransferase RfbA [Pirellulaceae bacterium]MDP7018000.1 glucose-1-phosphate thymidylyltransferase RfbA [Pirellulaceae bacterium]